MADPTDLHNKTMGSFVRPAKNRRPDATQQADRAHSAKDARVLGAIDAFLAVIRTSQDRQSRERQGHPKKGNRNDQIQGHDTESVSSRRASRNR